MTRAQRYQVRVALREMSQQIRALKEVRDESGQKRWNFKAVDDLAKLKSRATIFAALAARHRAAEGGKARPHIASFPFTIGRGAIVQDEAAWLTILDQEEGCIAETIVRAAPPETAAQVEQAVRPQAA